MRKILLLLIVLGGFTACNIKTETNDKRADNPISFAVLYNYYATEYQALCLQAYNSATTQLKEIHKKSEDPSNQAIVLDIDETVLDNSPYQAAAVIGSFSYPDNWNLWCNQASARAIPGSLEFLKMADSLSFRIFYISNRKHDFVLEATIENLKKLGFPQVSEENILLRQAKSESNPDPSDKESRRQEVRDKGIKIIMLVGDNMGDFYSDTETLEERKSALNKSRADFGCRYIVLPNAMYGNWPASIDLDGSSDAIFKKLEEMAFRFEDL